MDPIYQRLKELDSRTFERLCFHLLKERHPNGGIRHVDGAGGDGGVDVFGGDMDGGPVIWQCKSFPNNIRDSQKKQIRESFSSAAGNFMPRRWILCLSVDMDSSAQRWFQRFAKSKNSVVEIGLWQASDIVHALIYHRAIRNEFFPQAIIDAMQLRELILQNTDLTDHELTAVASENVDQLVERLRRRDPRFNYEITFSPEIGSPLDSPLRPGLIATIADDKKTIHVYARDQEALRLDPPQMYFNAVGDGVRKVLEFNKVGGLLELGPGEITDLRCDLFSLCLPSSDGVVSSRVQISRQLNLLESLNMRVCFGSVTYEYVEFRISRVGTDELELESKGELPFEMQVTISADLMQSGRVKFTSQFDGCSYRDIIKFMRAIDSVRDQGSLEIYNLKLGRTLIKASVGEIEGDLFSEPLRLLVSDAVFVCDHYGIELRYTSELAADLAAFERLVNLAKGILQPVRSLRLKLKKTSNVVIDKNSTFRLSYPSEEILVFGACVSTGPVISDFGKANVAKAEMIRHNQASIGDTVEITIRPSTGIRVFASPLQKTA